MKSNFVCTFEEANLEHEIRLLQEKLQTLKLKRLVVGTSIVKVLPGSKKYGGKEGVVDKVTKYFVWVRQPSTGPCGLKTFVTFKVALKNVSSL